jgi:glucose-1-phosphate adenylyltransferase
MDLLQFLEEHLESKAEISIASTPVTRKAASSFGILSIDRKGFINNFKEKPGPDADISEFKLPEDKSIDVGDGKKEYLASMGIYIFNTDILRKCLDSDFSDFGKEIIPDALNKYKVKGFIYDGYWEDIGTIRSFYEANLNLASLYPYFNLYDELKPIYSINVELPPSKINTCTFRNTLAGEGAIITDAFINNSLVGIRSIIDSGASLENVYCMGADLYETDDQKRENNVKGIPNIGIGAGSIIKNTIIDKNARIGRNCRVGVDSLERKDSDNSDYYIREGIIIIGKNAVLNDGAVV